MTLYFLTHPGSELFSGYGIPAQDEQRDHLYGLIMVDRPRPVSSEWLGDVAEAFGEAKLYQMTPHGDRGLLSQLYVRKESLGHVQEKLAPMSPYLEAAVRENCAVPPKPKLETWWDSEHRLWRSAFRREPMKVTLRRVSYGKRNTPPEQREYSVPGWGTAVGTVQEIAAFIQAKLGAQDFMLELYDPISSPDKDEQIGFGRCAQGEKE